MKVTVLTSSLLRLLTKSPRGATATEYAIMVTLIGMVVIAGVTALGLATNGLFQSAVDNMP